MAEKWTHRLRRQAARMALRGLPLDEPAPELPPITPEQVAEAQALFPRPKFFIFGYPRSGTTLLARLVRTHSQVHCNWQAHFFTRRQDATQVITDIETRRWLARSSNHWSAGKNLDAMVIRILADFLMEREADQHNKAVVGDKTPNSNGGLAVTRLHAVYPDAWLINIVRDGRDAALSHRFQMFIDHPQNLDRAGERIRAAFIQDAQPFIAKQRSVFSPPIIRREAQDWAGNVQDTHRLGQVLFGSRYLALRFEDLVAQPVAHMRQLWDFLPVEAAFEGLEAAVTKESAYNPSSEGQKEKEPAMAAQLRHGQRGSWRDFFTERDVTAFKQYAGQALIDWKYESSMDWK